MKSLTIYLRNLALITIAMVSLTSCGNDFNDMMKEKGGGEPPVVTPPPPPPPPPPVPVVVSDLNLTTLVGLPKTGETPTPSITAPQYYGSLDWNVTGGSTHSGDFVHSTAYTATVILTAHSGYTFTGVAQDSFTHTSAADTNVTNAEHSGIVRIEFPQTDTTVSDLNLTSKIAAPVTAAPPVTSFNSTEYNGTVAWKITGGSAHSGSTAFAPGIAYTATVTLTTNSGYTFNGVSADSFTHSGATGGTPTNSADDGTVTIVFPDTAAPVYAISLIANSSNPAVSGSSDLTATVTETGNSVSGQNVVFTWKVKGSTTMPPQTGGTGSTNGSGEAAWTLTGSSGDRRTITVTATLQSDTSKTDSVDIQFGNALPSGFIALASYTMNWTAAGTYCSNQGGRLPKVNGSTSGGVAGVGDPIEGFGNKGGAWPSSVPAGDYWSATTLSSNTSKALFISEFYGIIDGDYGKTNSLRVICVP